jgi:tetratricopeptide (TPR) repeat protein
MTKPSPWAKPVIQIAAAGLGAAIAGPLGGAIGGWLGDALGNSATELVKKATEQFGEKAGEKLLDTGTDLLLDQLKDTPANLESLYRDSLRLSLDSIRAHLDPGLSDSADWFVNWKTCLTAGMPLDLPALQPGELVSANLDHLFCRTMERLDAQGNAIRLRATSINLVERTLPESLLAVLSLQLPERLNQTFAALVVTPAYEQAWKQISFTMLKGLQQDNKQILTGLAAANEKLDALGTDLQAVRANAEASAVKDQLLLITQTQLVQEIASKEDWRQKYLDLLASSGPTLQDFLARGDLAGAAQFTQQKIEKEKATQAQNYFDYGSVQELQFHFAAALDAYREAWKIKQDAKYGFRYGYIAQVQNHWSEAIGIYETLVEMNVDPQRVAITLNNLAGLYRLTRRDQAEEAWGRALAIHRDLAKTDPEAQAPFIAAVLNNLGVLNAQSNRAKEAEDALTEALTIRRKLVQAKPEAPYLSELASTLNNLGSLVYLGPGRRTEADQALGEALQIRRDLAKANQDLYLPELALTLMNVAQFCKTAGGLENAESAYVEAFSIRSKLAKANPEAYTDKVGLTLNALGDFYRDRKRKQDAEQAYFGALNIRSNLAKKDSATYLPQVCETLNGLGYLYHVNQLYTDAEPLYLGELSNYQSLERDHPGRYAAKIASTQNLLGVLYGDMKRNEDAEKAFFEALSVNRKLAAADPKTYSKEVASTLNNLAAFYGDIGRINDAKACCDEAEQILGPMVSVDPQVSGELLAKGLWTRALLSERLGESAAEACQFARRALDAAATEGTKQGLRALVEGLCAEPPGKENPPGDAHAAETKQEIVVGSSTPGALPPSS